MQTPAELVWGETREQICANVFSSASGCVKGNSYMAQEAVADTQRVVAAALQLLEEVLAVEVHQLFQVAEDNAAFTPQVLRQVSPLHLGEVVVNDVAQRAHVFPLCRNHLVHDVTQLTVRWRATRKHSC